MAYYHVHGLIPDTLAQSEGYQLFEQYIANGAPKDNFDGFELISRVHAPQTGEVFVTCKADNHLKVAEHLLFGEQNLVLSGTLSQFLMMKKLSKGISKLLKK